MTGEMISIDVFITLDKKTTVKGTEGYTEKGPMSLE